jgi:predicted  nucleic acid-binding Zn-ribbon protein
MTEWNVILVLIEVVGLFFLVGKPLINLNTTIATLKASVDILSSRLDNTEEKNREAHKEFHEHFKDVDTELQDHEYRIKSLESK